MTSFKQPERFWSKVNVGGPDECWEWTASRHRQGYGIFWIRDRHWYAHRVAWTLTYGPIPEGLHCCHHCDNPSCCNPYHLFLGTPRDNAIDALKKGRKNTLLRDEDVLEIRKLLEEDFTGLEISNRYGVSDALISEIKHKKIYTWVEEED